MDKLIVVAGNSGVGKTTLTQTPSARMVGFATGLEHLSEATIPGADERRFAALWAGQSDRLTCSTGQSRSERTTPEQRASALVDGGLDLDYYGFTHLFHHKGYLTDAEFALCGRLYARLRAALGPPDLVLRLIAPQEMIERRFEQRGRPLEIAEREDLAVLGQFMDKWLDELPPERCLLLDVSEPGSAWRAGDPGPDRDDPGEVAQECVMPRPRLVSGYCDNSSRPVGTTAS